MNSKNKHKMNGLTRKDIQTYLTSKEELKKQEIEKKSLESDFDAEALEGFASINGSIADLNQLDKKFLPKKSIPLWSTVALAGALIIGAVIFYNNQKQPEKITTAVNNLTEITEVFLPDSITTLVIQPTKELAKLEKIKQPKADSELKKEEGKVEPKKEFIPIASIPILKPDFQKVESKNSKMIAKEIYLHDLKLIDYRAYRNKTTIEVEGITLSGTPAELEKQLAEKDEELKVSLSIPYHDYIKKTMVYFKDANFKQVVARCNNILSIYPDDLNAQFYAGVAYYNLGEFQKAINLFIQCINAPMNNFEVEAEWMLANSYEKNGETHKAKAIYQVIKQNGGYYSNQVPK